MTADLIQITQALRSLRPGAQWSLRGDQLEWHDEKQTRPSDDEIAFWISSPTLTENDYGIAVQEYIEQVAKARGYADAVTCASYSVSTVPAWQAEAQAFIAWRDLVWSYVFEQLTAVQSQQREQPTIDALIAELPAIKWER